MSENKINITSTALEKGIDIAKSFLEKLIFPTVEETGLLLKDKITFWRFKNQVKMLNKAQDFCIKNNIKPKNIPLKLVSPMLDYSAIEEDEKLQDKWAILLSNMVDSDQNIENHVFPYVLSQLSINEFEILETIYWDTIKIRNKAKTELEKFYGSVKERKSNLETLIHTKTEEILKIKKTLKRSFSDEIWSLQKEIREIEIKKSALQIEEWKIKGKIHKKVIIPKEYLEEFELSNLIRLGLVKEEKDVHTTDQEMEIPVGEANDMGYLYYSMEIDLHTTIEYNMTQLGEMFIDACTEKIKKAENNV